jgi:signal transduction histidine kinase
VLPQLHTIRTSVPAWRERLSSVGLVLLLDAALMVNAVLMVATDLTVFFFHIVFVLLAIQAFMLRFRSFAVRAVPWVSFTTLIVLRAVMDGTTQSDELIEIPLLSLILATTFVIASKRERARSDLGRANERLERAFESQSRLVSVISHEFRTPLTGIQGFSEMIRDDEMGIDEARNLANDINIDALRLGRMISDMLDLDRMRSGGMSLRLERVDLNAMIQELTRRIQLGSPHHPLELALDATLPPASADRDRLTQVVTNLVNNAIKYSPGGSKVRISSQAEDRVLHVAVTDLGLGIAPADLETVFDPYTRVETAQTREIVGTGLGLPIAREIVRLHGGRMWAESDEGHGSTFHFTLLPAAEAA